jgi:hypothetical protein
MAYKARKVPCLASLTCQAPGRKTAAGSGLEMTHEVTVNKALRPMNTGASSYKLNSDVIATS